MAEARRRCAASDARSSGGEDVTAVVLITAGIAARLVLTLAAGLLASYWPARAATRIEPTVALRAE